MNKTINITINRLVFALEEEAYKRLLIYLEAIKSHFSRYNYGTEVISDIESRIAEQFSKLIGPKQQVITDSDVISLIKIMGSVEDIASTPTAGPAVPFPPKQTGVRRYYRSTDDVMIAGVASGLAAYFDWDATIVRLLFVLIGLTTFIVGPYAIAAYLILWLVVPKAESASAKLEMKGAPVTLAKLEESVKEKTIETAAKIRQPAREITSFIGRAIRFCIRLMLILAGIFIAAFVFIGILFFTFLFAQIIFNSASPYIDFPFKTIFAGTQYYVLASSLFLTVLIPLSGALFAAISLIRRKLTFNKIATASLGGIWLIAMITASVVLFRGGPAIEAAAKEYSQEIQTSYPVSGFTEISIESNDDVRISYGKEFSVTARYLEKDQRPLSITQENGLLKVARKKNEAPAICFFCNQRKAEIEIVMPRVDKVRSNRAAMATIEGFKQDKLSLELGGFADARFVRNELDTLSVTVKDTAGAILEGKYKRVEITSEDVARVNSKNFSAESAIVVSEDTSTVRLGEISSSLKVTAADVARVYYMGTPKTESVITKQARLRNLTADEDIFEE